MKYTSRQFIASEETEISVLTYQAMYVTCEKMLDADRVELRIESD